MKMKLVVRTIEYWGPSEWVDNTLKRGLKLGTNKLGSRLLLCHPV